MKLRPPAQPTQTTVPPDTQTLLCSETHERSYLLASKFRIHLFGMYFNHFAEEWDSGDVRESDYIHHIDITFSGNRQVLFGKRVYDLKPGQVWFLPANAPVGRRCRERCEVLYFKFHTEWLPGVDPLLDWPQREPRCIGEVDPEAWREWMKAGKNIGMVEQLQLRANLASWIATAIPELESVVSHHLETHTRFSNVFQYIEKHLGADLRLATLAGIHGTTQSAFSNAFIRATGISAKDYISRRLNQEALQMVINSDLRIKEIAAKLHFSDEFYFSRFFQRLNGTSPTQYRMRFRQI